MKTLDDHNKDAYARLQEKQQVKTDVTCPKCQTEMMFRDPGRVLLSYPPQRWVKCPSCNHTGLMVQA